MDEEQATTVFVPFPPNPKPPSTPRDHEHTTHDSPVPNPTPTPDPATSTNLPPDPNPEIDFSRHIHTAHLLPSPEAERRSQNAIHILTKRVPAFRGREGRPTAFQDLEFGVQCGLITCLVRPIEDAKGYLGEMPVGKWSDHENERVEYTPGRDGGVYEANAGGRSVGGDYATATGPQQALHIIPASMEDALRTPPAPTLRGRPYEILAPVDGSSTVYARQFPALEGWAHASKYRASQGQMLLRELRAEGKSPFTPVGLSEGGKQTMGPESVCCKPEDLMEEDLS